MIASVVLLLVALVTLSTVVYAQSYANQITFDNSSGNDALVKLVGPTGGVVAVPNNRERTVRVAPGTYFILVRYGDAPSNYAYTRGQTFSVEQVGNMYSVITITLHKVIGGNYESHSIPAADFER
jgi:ABC-type Fe3+-hydroxamate transport system substrate-binding protein